jgi:hypothetical protein
VFDDSFEHEVWHNGSRCGVRDTFTAFRTLSIFARALLMLCGLPAPFRAKFSHALFSVLE